MIHAAGVLDDGTIESLDRRALERVFAPKADAAWHLHELTAGLDLSAFVLFSSIAGTLGGPGQGNYAAANAFLDALAAQRRGEGLPATSIAWGLWERESGMAAELSEADLARMRRSGIELLSDEQGLDALRRGACRRGCPLALAVPARPRAAFAPAPPPGSCRRSCAGSSACRPAAARLPARSLATKLAAASEAEREALVLELVRAEVAAVLGHASAEAVDPERAFKDLGFDSLAAVELRNRLGASDRAAAAGRPSSSTTRTRRRWPGTCWPRPAPAGRRARGRGPGPGRRDEPIAIVGMACRYPGGVDSPDGLWELVAEGRDAIAGVPRRPRLGPGAPLRPRPRAPRHQLHARRRLPGRRRRFRRRVLRHLPARGAGDATPSSGCCWKPPGRRWRTPASIPARCAAARPASSPG